MNKPFKNAKLDKVIEFDKTIDSLEKKKEELNKALKEIKKDIQQTKKERQKISTNLDKTDLEEKDIQIDAHANQMASKPAETPQKNENLLQEISKIIEPEEIIAPEESKAIEPYKQIESYKQIEPYKQIETYKQIEPYQESKTYPIEEKSTQEDAQEVKEGFIQWTEPKKTAPKNKQENPENIIEIEFDDDNNIVKAEELKADDQQSNTRYSWLKKRMIEMVATRDISYYIREESDKKHTNHAFLTLKETKQLQIIENKKNRTQPILNAFIEQKEPKQQNSYQENKYENSYTKNPYFTPQATTKTDHQYQQQM